MSGRVKSILRRLLPGERVLAADARAHASSFVEVERAERIFYLQYLREGMTVFAAGANVGELTLLFSRFVGERRRLHPIQPPGARIEPH